MKFSIWSNLDNLLIKMVKIITIEKDINPNDIEFFIAFPWYNLALNRYPCQNRQINIKDFLMHIKLITNCKFNLRYVFNTFDIDIEKNKTNIDFILNILISLWQNKLTIVDPKLINYIEDNFKGIFKIWLSAVIRINSISKFEKNYWLYKFDKIILSHSVNYNIKLLKELINYFNNIGTSVELIWNELTRCDSQCKVCTIYDSLQWWLLNIEQFNKCSWNKDNIRYFNESNIIRPENVNIYEELGIKTIKLALRKTNTNRAIKIIRSYFSWQHKWNFFELLWDWHDPIFPYLDNTKLDKYFILK